MVFASRYSIILFILRPINWVKYSKFIEFMTTKADEKFGKHSLDDLLWEHDAHSAKLKQIAFSYIKKLRDNFQDHYNAGSERILNNCLMNFKNKLNCLPKFIYIDNLQNSALKIMFVFDHSVFSEEIEDQAYSILPKIQDLSISNDSRDFRWRIMDDLDFEPEVPLEEYGVLLMKKE